MRLKELAPSLDSYYKLRKLHLELECLLDDAQKGTGRALSGELLYFLRHDLKNRFDHLTEALGELEDMEVDAAIPQQKTLVEGQR